jgi:hypothetical protein
MHALNFQMPASCAAGSDNFAAIPLWAQAGALHALCLFQGPADSALNPSRMILQQDNLGIP